MAENEILKVARKIGEYAALGEAGVGLILRLVEVLARFQKNEVSIADIDREIEETEGHAKEANERDEFRLQSGI
jgi:hypothetical protein